MNYSEPLLSPAVEARIREIIRDEIERTGLLRLVGEWALHDEPNGAIARWIPGPLAQLVQASRADSPDRPPAPSVQTSVDPS